MSTFRAILRRSVSIPYHIIRWPFRQCRKLLGSLRFWIFVLLFVLAIIITYYALAEQLTPITTDAYVQAYVVQVAPQVEGQVVHVAVHEGDEVKAGDLLFELDPRPFQHKADLLEARRALADYEVLGLEAELAAAKAEQERNEADSKLADVIYKQEKQLIKKANRRPSARYKESGLAFRGEPGGYSERPLPRVKRAEQALAAPRWATNMPRSPQARGPAKRGAPLNLDYTPSILRAPVSSPTCNCAKALTCEPVRRLSRSSTPDTGR